MWVFLPPASLQEILACSFFFLRRFGKPASLLLGAKTMPPGHDWTFHKWQAGDLLEMKAASRIMKSRIAKTLFVMTF